MHSEVPRYINVAVMLGLFSFIVVNESLSINNLMFCKENNTPISILKFGYGINCKYEGMLVHSFDRFYVVTKFILPSIKDLEFY